VARANADELAAALGRALGGEVHQLRRLSGGASRVTSSFDLELDGNTRPLILQQERAGAVAEQGKSKVERALLEAAHAAGVPVPAVVASGEDDALGSGWLVVDRMEGETIPRKILRDPEWATARAALTPHCGHALAAIHSIDPDGIAGLPRRDPLRDPLPILDLLGETRPALELGVRWLEAHRPPTGARTTVHGDFRCGNLLVGPDGLRAVLDWELAHAGDPAEDVGWLCAPAWRFGGRAPVGGFGEVDDLLASYRQAGGEAIDLERVHWWQVSATVKWATICAMQASAHLGGSTRSVELATIGRRVCESEWDLFCLLGTAPAGTPSTASAEREVLAPFGRPTAAELVEAVSERFESAMEQGEGADRFEARVARNALQIVERQLALGSELAESHRARLAELGFADDRALAVAIRSGSFDEKWQDLAVALSAAARDQLLVANPGYLPAASE
jgi:aminoglycoside phosphotransferase (APT) family kinase protein